MAIHDSHGLLSWLKTANSNPTLTTRIGTVVSTSPCQIAFDGDVDDLGNAITTQASLASLSSYTALAGDRVQCIKSGNAWLIIGAITTTPAPTWTTFASAGIFATNVADYNSSVYDGCAYTKVGNVVHFKGLAATSAGIAVNGTLWTMPVGYRISATSSTGVMLASVMGSAASAIEYIRLYMDSTGHIKWNSPVGLGTLPSGTNFEIGTLKYLADS